MPNDADSLTENDADGTSPLAMQSDGHEVPVEDDENPVTPEHSSDPGDETRQVDRVDLDSGAGEVGAFDLDAPLEAEEIVTMEDLHGDDFDDALDDPDDFGDFIDPVGPGEEFGAQGAALFDGDPEEYELDLGSGPYPDTRAEPGDLIVLDEPTGPTAPPLRRMSRMERRRRVRLQARRVRRIIRHVEPWSVLKISIFFYACLWVIFLVAGFMIWGVAESSGTVDKLENLIRELFALETFDFDAGQIFRGYALGGLALSIAGTTFNVLMCLLFNLISDLTGGLRITMIEEETARPTPPRRRRRRPPSRR